MFCPYGFIHPTHGTNSYTHRFFIAAFENTRSSSARVTMIVWNQWLRLAGENAMRVSGCGCACGCGLLNTPVVHIPQVGQRDNALLHELTQHLDGRPLRERGRAVQRLGL